MTLSRQEEIIAGLWAICALLAFGFEYPTWGWIFAIKAGLDTVSATVASVQELRLRKQIRKAIRREDDEQS